MTQEIYYLNSVLRQLREIRDLVANAQHGPSIGTETLADNINWLDCHIDSLQRGSETDDQLAEQISRVAGCQVGSDRTRRIIEWYRGKTSAAPSVTLTGKDGTNG